MPERSFSLSRVIRAAIWLVVVIVGCFLLLEGIYAAEGYWRRQHQQLTVRPKIAGVVYIKGTVTGGIQLRVAKVGRVVPQCSALPVVATSDAMGGFVAPALREPRFRAGRKQISLAICVTRGKATIDSWVTTYKPGAVPPILLMCEFPIEEGARSKVHACFNMP
jgi:hypothetical protein